MARGVGARAVVFAQRAEHFGRVSAGGPEWGIGGHCALRWVEQKRTPVARARVLRGPADGRPIQRRAGGAVHEATARVATLDSGIGPNRTGGRSAVQAQTERRSQV